MKEDVLTDDRLPKGVLTLVTIQIACAIWTRRYTASGAEQGTATPNRIVYRLVGPWPHCDDSRPEFYRLILYQFVHGSWLHLIANALTQIVFGLRWSSRMVPPKILGVHSAGVIAGALTCAVCDAYAIVIGASGGAYAFMGAHVGAIFKDWDRLRHGVFDRRTRLVVFAFILGADVLQWALTREPGVSYASHVGAAAGFVVGRGHSAAAAGAIEFGFYEAPGPARRAPGADFVGVSVRVWNHVVRGGLPTAAIIAGLVRRVQFWRAALLPPGLVLRRGADGRADLRIPRKRRDVGPGVAGGRCSGAAVQLRRRSSLRTRRRMSRCSSHLL